MTSPNKSRFVIDPDFSEALLGMSFFSLKNSKGSSVIPSTKNFVGTFQIEKIKCDDDASCTVLPISSLDMLRLLFDTYKDCCMFSITQLKSVAGDTLALVVESKSSPIFEIRLGLDVFPVRKLEESFAKTSSSTLPGDAFPIDSSNCLSFPPMDTVSVLNFFLCSEDIDFILRPDNADILLALQKTASSALVVPYSFAVPRRNSALLGQDFLGREYMGSLHYGRLKFYMDTRIHKLEKCTWDVLDGISQAITNMGYLKNGCIDFQILDSIEPNDIMGKAEDLDQDLYDDTLELF